MRTEAEKPQTREIANEILLGTVSEIMSGGQDVILMAKGSSMLPFIRGGRDSVLLRKKDAVNVGDIVLACLPNGNYVLHRVVASDGENLTLMGDGNVSGTEKCRTTDVCGTAIEIIRPSGRRVPVVEKLWWRKLLPVRRWLLAIYRRTWYRF